MTPSDAGPKAASSLRAELKKLGASSLIYLVPTFLARGVSFLLSPVYAAVLGPAEFGIVGFASSLVPLISLLLGFGVSNSANRMHHDFKDDEERRSFYGSVVLFVIVAPLGLGVLVHAAASVFGSPFRTLPFEPYGSLVLWAGVFGVIPSAFVNIFVARENPRTVVTYNVATVAALIGATVLMVVVLRRGALGQLWASLLAAVFNATLALYFLRRVVTWTFSWPKLRAALLFGVPIVPHQLSSWAMSASDRAILERSVTAADLGRYSLGYTFGAVTSFVGLAISLALGPVVHRRLKARADDEAVPKIGSFALLVTTFVGLEVALLGGPALLLVTRADYRGAELIVPWISLANVFQAAYQTVSLGTFFSKRTTAVPFVSAAAAGTNILLNLWLVPRYGIIAAAITTLVAYMVLAVAHGLLAHKMHPIAWEYGRLARIAAAALITYFVASRIESPAGTALVARLAMSLLFPVLLLAFGAVTAAERRRALELVRARRARRR